MAKTIKVLLADDHPSVRESIKRILESLPQVAVIAEASDGGEAVALATTHRPDIVLMDVSMPNVDGLEAARRIGRDVPGVAVVVVTAYGDRDIAARAFKVGAAGFLIKNKLVTELAPAVDAIARGECYFGSGVESRWSAHA